MKKIKYPILIIFYLFLYNCLYSQFEFDCTIIDNNSRNSGFISNSDDYIPTNSTPMKIIRINIHFILKSVGDPAYPGNFTPNSDGNGSVLYNGYNYAMDLINVANSRLSSNSQMNLPSNNTTNVLNRKYQYYLNAVFFHANSTYYYYPSNSNSLYSENSEECVNVYLNHTNGTNSGGSACLSGNRYVYMKGAWERYVQDIASGRSIMSGLWVYAQLLNHEIGHNLSLLHTMRTYNGICHDSIQDYCEDTPIRKDMILANGVDPCCGWNPSSIYCSNNMMDYNGNDAITPQQLGRVHWTIENEMNKYKKCNFNTPIINITNFTQTKAFIANTVIVPNNLSIVVDENKALFINANNVNIEGGFEVKLGGFLQINCNESCN